MRRASKHIWWDVDVKTKQCGHGGGGFRRVSRPWTPSSFNQFGDFCLATLYLFRRTISSKKKTKKKADVLFVRCIPRVRGIRAHLSARFIFFFHLQKLKKVTLRWCQCDCGWRWCWEACIVILVYYRVIVVFLLTEFIKYKKVRGVCWFCVCAYAWCYSILVFLLFIYSCIYFGEEGFQQSFEWVCVPVLSSHQHCWGFLHLGEKANVRDKGLIL